MNLSAWNLQFYGCIKDDKGWRIRYNTYIYDLYKGTKVALIKFRRMQWAGHVIRMEEHYMKVSQMKTLKV